MVTRFRSVKKKKKPVLNRIKGFPAILHFRFLRNTKLVTDLNVLTCLPFLYWLNQLPGVSLFHAANFTCAHRDRRTVGQIPGSRDASQGFVL